VVVARRGARGLRGGDLLGGTGLSFPQTLRYVILPQAVRLGIPPLTNRAISITKNLALGSAIGVNEILGRANSALSMSANATPLTIGALLYVLVFIPLVVASRMLEHSYRWGGR
jgi:polar amino acid transport system permease protein